MFIYRCMGKCCIAGCIVFIAAIYAPLIYFFYMYGYTQPDEADCWIGVDKLTGMRIVSPT